MKPVGVLTVDRAAIDIESPPPVTSIDEFDTATFAADVEPSSCVADAIPGFSSLAMVVPFVPIPDGPVMIGSGVGVSEGDVAWLDVSAGVVEVATTVKTYGVPFVSPLTRQEVPVVVHVSPPGPAVTV